MGCRGGSSSLGLAPHEPVALRVTDELKCESIALPAISTGIFGFPKDRAAGIIFANIEKYFEDKTSNIKIIKMLLFDQATVDVFVDYWQSKWSE